MEDVIQAMRLDLQSSRADIMAKNMTLTAEQAAKFWPVFDAYQKEQNGIIDGQLQGHPEIRRELRHPGATPARSR